MIKRFILTSVLGLVASATFAGDIIDTAKSAGTFKTLIAALDAAGKTKMLQEDGPFTVFAPSDEAFAKLPAGTLDDLLKPENKKKLGNILAYHVLKGKVMAAEVKTMMAKTANGQELDIKVTDGLRHRNSPVRHKPYGLDLELTAEPPSRHIHSPAPWSRSYLRVHETGNRSGSIA